MGNVVATYSRSILAAGLALFSSRWVLNALGQTDFGLYSLVGSLIPFITFLNGVLSGSVARHFAFAIGRGKSDDLSRCFNVALSIHIGLAVILISIGWPVGEYILTSFLTIPTSRLDACLLAFRASIIASFISMISVPFTAMFTARQDIRELALWGLLSAGLMFLLAWCLRYFSGDPLVFYASGAATIIVVVQVAQVLRARQKYTETRVLVSRHLDGRRSRELVTFAGWSLFGGAGALLREHGSAVLLNVYSGPDANASYGIAMRVSSAVDTLANAIAHASAPEITASEGACNRGRVLSLAQSINKMGTLLIMALAIPLMLEMSYVLKAWLIVPPPHAAFLCRALLAMWLIDRMTMGSMLAVSAHGRIAAYQATLGSILMLAIPLAWAFLWMGWSPRSVGIAFLITATGVSLGRAWWMRRLLGAPLGQWLRHVVAPCCLVAVAALGGTCLGRLVDEEDSAVKFLVAVAAGIGAAASSSWFVALDRKERQSIRQTIHAALWRIRAAS